MRVLIADDSAVSRHLLMAALSDWGYETLTAADGAQAWRILEQPDAPPLAILDWMMPGLTGPEVCRRVRQKSGEQYTYILLLTSRNLKEDLVEGMDAGADDYITKPFDRHELKVRLRAGTRIADLQRQLLDTQEALRMQATHDALTRLWNRGSVVEALQREVARGRREGSHTGVVMIDLDHFKSINDTHGHFAGDYALQEAANRMRTSIRSYDSLGRYGGEEFLCVLPGCDEACCRSQAERLREALESEPLILPKCSLTLSASFGCTVCGPGLRTSVESLLRAADYALYEAKRRGRNRVEFAECGAIFPAHAGA